MNPVIKRRCAIYTRKSSEEGLDQAFNSLHAQRDACAAYILSQKSEGWMMLSDRYDDGGVSGGTLERPALKRLIADIEAKGVDVVVVYKIDRLSRSLFDFAKLVEVFERHDVTFVSITQSFNTTTSMGRLTLNMLLSFAQFEREVISERIRDKVAASRARGIWMGGWAPLGYVVRNRRLIVEPEEARLVVRIFERFLTLRSVTRLTAELQSEGVQTKYVRKLLSKQALHRILTNRVYLGFAVHKGVAHPGEHDPIISQSLWDQVAAIMRVSPRTRGQAARCKNPALLKGLIFGPDGRPMSPTFATQKQKQYRYYTAIAVLKHANVDLPIRRVPAGPVEAAVMDQVRRLLRAPELIVRTARAAKERGLSVAVEDVAAALSNVDPVWNELFPAEQSRIVQLLVERVDVGLDGITLRLRTEGLTSLVAELQGSAGGAA